MLFAYLPLRVAALGIVASLTVTLVSACCQPPHAATLEDE